MTKLRQAVREEYPILEAMAESKGIGKPVFGLCFVLEEDGKVKGFVNGRIIGLLDTIVAETPQSARTLFTAIEASLLTAAPEADQFAIATNPEVGDMLRSQSWGKVVPEVFMKRR